MGEFQWPWTLEALVEKAEAGVGSCGVPAPPELALVKPHCPRDGPGHVWDTGMLK